MMRSSDRMRFGHGDVVTGTSSEHVIPSTPDSALGTAPETIVTAGAPELRRGRAAAAAAGGESGRNEEGGRWASSPSEIQIKAAPDTIIGAAKEGRRGQKRASPTTTGTTDPALLEKPPPSHSQGSGGIDGGSKGGTARVCVSEVPSVARGLRFCAEATPAVWERVGEEAAGIKTISGGCSSSKAAERRERGVRSDIDAGARVESTGALKGRGQGKGPDDGGEGEVEEEGERDWNDWCKVCKEGGLLLLCEGKGCIQAFHPKCLYPPLPDVSLAPSCSSLLGLWNQDLSRHQILILRHTFGTLCPWIRWTSRHSRPCMMHASSCHHEISLSLPPSLPLSLPLSLSFFPHPTLHLPIPIPIPIPTSPSLRHKLAKLRHLLTFPNHSLVRD